MRRFTAFFAVVASIVLSGVAGGQEPGPGPVDVIEVSGVVDDRIVDFVLDAVNGSDAQLVILQIDSPGAVTRRIDELLRLVASPPVPVAAYVGPAPARAYGGVAQLVAATPIRAAAPQAKVGFLLPTVSGDDEPLPAAPSDRFGAVPRRLLVERRSVEGPIPGLVDIVTPSIGQLIVLLDGTTVVAPEPVELRTAVLVENEDGSVRPEPAVVVRFDEPGLLTRTLRIAARPEAAMFFLVAGLALAAFEFYAAGVGVMAAVSVLSLVLSAYGLATLPVRWWAVALVVAGVGLYAADFQRNDLGLRSLAGTAGLVVGGLWFTSAEPHFAPVWWTVLAITLGAGLFFGIGMTAVVRARFSTRMIGREHLIGRTGIAQHAFSPDGVVDLDGAQWRARSTRAADITPGDVVEVVGVDGVILQVDPVRE